MSSVLSPQYLCSLPRIVRIWIFYVALTFAVVFLSASFLVLSPCDCGSLACRVRPSRSQSAPYHCHRSSGRPSMRFTAGLCHSFCRRCEHLASERTKAYGIVHSEVTRRVNGRIKSTPQSAPCKY